MNPMEVNPYELFKQECPDLAASLDDLLEAQQTLPGLDSKTRQLINIAIQTANRNPRGVAYHAIMARDAGVGRAAVAAAVVMNLHLSGLGPVLDCLPAALQAFED